MVMMMIMMRIMIAVTIRACPSEMMEEAKDLTTGCPSHQCEQGKWTPVGVRRRFLQG